jgi:hypothetical protein
MDIKRIKTGCSGKIRSALGAFKLFKSVGTDEMAKSLPQQ